MKPTNVIKNFVNVAAAFVVSAVSVATASYADWQQIGVMGDLNNDGSASVADLVIMTQHLNNQKKLTNQNMYRVNNAYLGINGESFQGEQYFCTADINSDNKVDVFDLILLRNYVANSWAEPLWQWFDETPQETTATSEIATTTTTETVSAETTATTVANSPDDTLISPPIDDLTKNIPSQGEADIVIFYVDFPDCKYETDFSAEQVEEIAFGAENADSSSYPFESISAFYSRSSMGVSQIKGKAFRYTAKENISSYDNDKQKLLKECCKAFEDSADFTQFDGDKNGVIDATIITVPKESDDDAWWACAGPSGLDGFKVDGMKVGHLITGDCEITSASDCSGFVSSYSHEIGHGMGLPDYYRYNSGSDFEGLHGLAGIELMDDALSDFGAVSKLHLGWYTKNQINVYDSSLGKQTYTLGGSQTENANCLLIPCGELDSKYHSEYFVVEYNTNDVNNSYMRDVYYNNGSGIRVYHVSAETYDNGYWVAFKYESGGSFDNGRRFIRITNDTEGYDNYYHTGDVIDSSVSGFCWYDENQSETVDPKVKITVGELTENGYSITVENT
ncbi:MAG: hypothetical protein IJ666_04730 [Ruminococcus sp.]|nr:hypothetical protein [Ruminococcus sp.]